MTGSLHLGLWELIGLRVVLASAAATLGAAIAVAFRKINHFGLCLLISFAAGALLAVALFDILPETLSLVGPLRGGIAFLSGYLLFFLITKFVFHICPACSATHTEMNFKAITAAMIVALSIHSFMDGLAIYSGTRKVQFSDRSVEYHSIDDMRKAMADVNAAIAAASSSTPSSFSLAVHSRD